MPKLTCARATTVAVLGRTVTIDHPEKDGRWSAEVSKEEAEFAAGTIAAGKDSEFSVEGIDDQRVSVADALKPTAKRPKEAE